MLISAFSAVVVAAAAAVERESCSIREHVLYNEDDGDFDRRIIIIPLSSPATAPFRSNGRMDDHTVILVVGYSLNTLQ